ncbi:MAG: hypothetical protein RQ833_10520 [Sphingomonadaceae bacterium]|nr:hypothetical protein [Sphingomonadaceae bacterium]
MRLPVLIAALSALAIPAAAQTADVTRPSPSPATSAPADAAPPIASTQAPVITRSRETAARVRYIDVIGRDACPKSSDPNEVIVCNRLPEESQFRLPPAVRAEQIQARDNVRAERAALTNPNLGTAAPCSATGVGGQYGCTQGLNVLSAGKKAVQAVRGEDSVPDKVPQ